MGWLFIAKTARLHAVPYKLHNVSHFGLSDGVVVKAFRFASQQQM